MGRGRRRVVVSAVSAALLFVLSQCSIYDASLLDPNSSATLGKNGEGFWSGPGDRGCFSAGHPVSMDRPTGTTDKALPPITLAVQTTRLGSLGEDGQLNIDAWKDIGFDLDGVCTGSEDCDGTDSPPSCQPTVPQLAIDGHGCRDNTFGRLEYAAALVPELSKTYGLSDDAFNCALCVGDYNYLFRVSDYNGEENDEQVRVDLYPSPGLPTPLPWNCADPSWKTHPCFTPDQKFLVSADSMAAPGPGPDLPPSLTFDDHAYVRDGYLVVAFPDNTYVWFPGYKALVVAYPLRVQKGILTGKLSKGGDNVWTITDGTIGGRVLERDLIEGFRDLGLCEADPNYQVMSDFVHRNLDILASGANNPTATCDAMSTGLAFTAQQVVAGAVATVEPLKECVKRGTSVDDAGMSSDAATDAPADAAKD